MHVHVHSDKSFMILPCILYLCILIEIKSDVVFIS